jgi:hypothetical protein
MKAISISLLSLAVLPTASHVFASSNVVPDISSNELWRQQSYNSNTSKKGIDPIRHLKNRVDRQRLTMASTYYYVTNSDAALLPRNNYDITIGNPMRGLGPNPDWLNYRDWTPSLPASVGDFKWRWDNFMLDETMLVRIWHLIGTSLKVDYKRLQHKMYMLLFGFICIGQVSHSISQSIYSLHHTMYH